MKTEKTMKAKKITLLSAVVAIAAVAITLTAVLLPKYKVTKASTGNEKKHRRNRTDDFTNRKFGGGISEIV